jgi:hypothetical protein
MLTEGWVDYLLQHASDAGFVIAATRSKFRTLLNERMSNSGYLGRRLPALAKRPPLDIGPEVPRMA